METRHCTQAMGSSPMDRTPPGFNVSSSSVPLRAPPRPTTMVLKPFFSFWLFVPFLGVDSPDLFLQSLLSCHRTPILVLGSWHIHPRFVFSSISQFSRGPYSSEAFFQNLFCSSIVEHLQAILFTIVLAVIIA